MTAIKQWVNSTFVKKQASRECNYANNYYGDQVCQKSAAIAAKKK